VAPSAGIAKPDMKWINPVLEIRRMSEPITMRPNDLES
jgi:hypothetical protein